MSRMNTPAKLSTPLSFLPSGSTDRDGRDRSSTSEAADPGSAVTATPPPGQWRHPRMDEIIRRTNSTRFDERNARALMWNIPLLVLSFYAHGALSSFGINMSGSIPLLSSHLPTWVHPFTLFISIARLIFTFNIYTAMRPLYGITDELIDIPLTPAQRSLLGLDPLSEHSTKVQRQLFKSNQIGNYVTPPRYTASPGHHSSASRTSTPRLQNLNTTTATATSRVNGGGSLGPDNVGSPTPGGSLFWSSQRPGPSASVRRGSFNSSFAGPGSIDLSGRRNLLSQSTFGASNSLSIGGGNGNSTGLGSGNSPQSSPARRQPGHSRSRTSITALPSMNTFDYKVSASWINGSGGGGNGGNGNGNGGGGSTASQPGTPVMGTSTGAMSDEKGAAHGKFLYERFKQSQSGNSVFT